MKAHWLFLPLTLGLTIATAARGAGGFGSPVVVSGLDTGEPGIDVGMIEPLRQAMAHRVLEPVLAQDGRIDEATERRLVYGRGTAGEQDKN